MGIWGWRIRRTYIPRQPCTRSQRLSQRNSPRQCGLPPEIRSQHIRVSFSRHFISPDALQMLASTRTRLAVVWRILRPRVKIFAKKQVRLSIMDQWAWYIFLSGRSPRRQSWSPRNSRNFMWLCGTVDGHVICQKASQMTEYLHETDMFRRGLARECPQFRKTSAKHMASPYISRNISTLPRSIVFPRVPIIWNCRVSRLTYLDLLERLLGSVT